jgi:uncharacterized protein
MVKSDYSHLLEFDGVAALFNAVTSRLVLAAAPLVPALMSVWHGGASPEAVLEARAVSTLATTGLLVDSIGCERDAVARLIRHSSVGKVRFSNLKLILTESCNLQCKYCVIERNLGDRPRASMSRATVDRALDVFAHSICTADRSPKTIMLYGGEPLLCWTLVEHAIRRARELESRDAFSGRLDIVLETNGTLITPRVAHVLEANRVLVQVSVDGPQVVHDEMRVYGSGSGSHNDAVRGFNAARDAGCVAVISAVFGRHVARDPEAVVEYFANELKPPTIGLDLLHLIEGMDNPAAVADEELCPAYIRAWLAARKHGLYVEHVVRRLRPFVEEQIRWKDCPSCGSRLVVRPDGMVGVCEAFLASGQFYGDYLHTGLPIPPDGPFAQWSHRCVVGSHACRACIAQAVCGGGCGYNAHVKYGDHLAKDDKVCGTSRALLLWAIGYLAKNDELRGKLKDTPLLPVRPEDKVSILGGVPLRPDILLRHVTEFAEGSTHP